MKVNTDVLPKLTLTVEEAAELLRNWPLEVHTNWCAVDASAP